MNEFLEGIRESISLSKMVEFEGTQVLNMSADIRSDATGQADYTISILNNKIYIDNLEHFREEIENFKQLIRDREDYLFEIYYPDVEGEDGDIDGDIEGGTEGEGTEEE